MIKGKELEDRRAKLLVDIEAFIAARGMGVTQFGIEANGNSDLVWLIRRGVKITYQTVLRVERYMADPEHCKFRIKPKYLRRGAKQRWKKMKAAEKAIRMVLDGQ